MRLSLLVLDLTSPSLTNPDRKLYPDHCVQETPGCALIHELDTSRLDATILKGTDARLESFSGFGPPFRDPRVAATDLEKLLREADVTRVFIAGIAFDVCVKCTAVDAVELGFTTFVVRDACRGVEQSAEGVQLLVDEFERKGVTVIDSDDPRLPF